MQCSVRDSVKRRIALQRPAAERNFRDVRVGTVCISPRSSFQRQWIALIESLAVAIEPQAALEATETNPRRTAQAFTSEFQENIPRIRAIGTKPLLSVPLLRMHCSSLRVRCRSRGVCPFDDARRRMQHRAPCSAHSAHTPQITIK